MIHQHETNDMRSISPEQTAAWNRLRAALDAVSGQCDCEASHLYWYTNLDQARVAAKAAGKPILSLRLLGRLDEEYNCANSRFFRTTLYANTEVSQYLRDHFILHWQSVRPVPRITIDFGDGRKIERTITGNSIHYILDSDGAVIDALPGLYGSKAFLKGLADAEKAALSYAALPAESRNSYLRQYHLDRYNVALAAYTSDLASVGSIAAGRITINQPASLIASGSMPSAQVAARVAAGKGLVERPMLNSFQKTDDATWAKIAALHQDEAALDAGAQRLIRSKNPTAVAAGRVAMTKYRAEDPLVTTLQNLQRSIAEDTVRNEYDLHLKIHQWFVSGVAPADLNRLNAKVYAELFLTPDSDPWLGLVPPDTFTGLDNNGLVTSPRTP